LGSPNLFYGRGQASGSQNDAQSQGRGPSMGTYHLLRRGRTPGSTEEKANSAVGEFSEEAVQQEEQRGQQGSRVNEETEGSGVQKPIPLSFAQGEWHDQPPLLHPEHLELIFETRSMVDDQIHRALQISQCLDMMYACLFQHITRTTMPYVRTTLRASSQIGKE
jgi:hypothetical protein